MSRVLVVLMSLFAVVNGAQAADLASQTVATTGFLLKGGTILWFLAAAIVTLLAVMRRKRLRNEKRAA